MSEELEIDWFNVSNFITKWCQKNVAKILHDSNGFYVEWLKDSSGSWDRTFYYPSPNLALNAAINGDRAPKP